HRPGAGHGRRSLRYGNCGVNRNFSNQAHPKKKQGLVMVDETIDTPRSAAGVGAARPEQALWSMIELALPSFAVGSLAFVAGPNTHGVERLLAGLAILAVLAATGLGMARAVRSAARVRRSEVAIAATMASLDRAGRVTRGVLATLEQDVMPALGK